MALRMAMEEHEYRMQAKAICEKTYLIEQTITLKALVRKGSQFYRNLKGVGDHTMRELARFFYDQGVVVSRRGWLNNHLYWPYTDDMPDE
jgi:hypothetical protein